MKNLSIFILILFLAACGPATGISENEKSDSESIKSDTAVLDIFTTAYPLAYFTERIGGERVNVNSVYLPGANEHTFEPTQQDMISLAEADLLFYIGLGLEGFIDDAQKTLKEENVKFVSTVKNISSEELVKAEENHEEEEESHAEEEEPDENSVLETDPHVWISPVLSQKLAKSIMESLLAADPEGREMYEANYEELIQELEQLDQSFVELSKNTENKTFFVSHAAFGYIAETYNFEQVAVAGLNSQDEPSQKELIEIVDLAKKKKIKYIVFEQNVSSKLTEVVQQEIGAQAVEMHNLGALTQEDLDNSESYFTLMEKNLQVLKTILN